MNIRLWLSVQNYFIGNHLRGEADVIMRFRVRMIFHLIVSALLIMALVTIVYLIGGYDQELVRTFFLFGLFIGSLFYLKYSKSICAVSHLILLLAFTNYIINVFFLFQKFDVMSTLLAAINIIFAFHVLGQRWGIIYFFIHFIPGMGIALIGYYKIHYTDYVPHSPDPVEQIISIVLVCFILIYLIYQYQEAFIMAKEKLEETLAKLQKAKVLAEEMNRMKTNFLSNMSHEIRTPINGIIGISQVIEQETNDPQLLEYIKMQKQSGRRLLNTITGILDLARLESGKEYLRLKEVDIAKLLRESIAAKQPIASDKGLTLSLQLPEEDLYCLSDKTMLFYIIDNVIGNAIKFTEKGSVVVDVKTHLDPQQITIAISDTGVGISKEFLPKLFNAFEQESTGHNRGYDGSGIGLSISKRYIELLGGQIHVDSVKGQGSTFMIILPRYFNKT